jgi:hypothetical protein
MNSQFDLEYRDASNNRSGATVIVVGEINQAMIDEISRNLDDGKLIIAHQVGLPTPAEVLHSEFGVSIDDHVYTTLEQWEDDVPTIADFLTDHPATIDITVEELARKIGSASWDISGEMDRQGLLDCLLSA